MILLIGSWGYAVAASLFGVLAIWHLRRRPIGARGHLLTGAFAVTALWGLAVAISGPDHPFARLGESARNFVWLAYAGLLLRVGRNDDPPQRHIAVTALHLTLGVVLGAQAALDVLPPFFAMHPALLAAFGTASLALRLVVAIGALVLVHNLYTAAAPDARWGIRMPVIALAAMWTYDLNAYTLGYLTPHWGAVLIVLRGIALTALVPAFALAAQRQARWRMKLSRTVTFQTLSLMAIGGYLVAMVLIVRVVELVGGSFTHLLQVVVVFGMTITAITLMPSSRLRAWAKVKVTKHFFQHRYDYRSEWLRFTETLAVSGEGAGPLDQRVIKALADIADSPAGLLLARAGEGGLTPAARWNWPDMQPPAESGSVEFAEALARTGWIVAVHGGKGGRARDLAVPDWLREEPRAWAAVPLVHLDRLVGVVVLAKPRVDRELDWEDLDLLRIAGRQAASYLAEALGQQALSDARRFDEFNRRFAFILHDIKNLASQIGLVARNAERHADKAAFRADMVATLQASAAKMNALLARLSVQERSAPAAPRLVVLSDLVAGAVAPRRAANAFEIEGDTVLAYADPVRLEQALAHLIQNAVDASAANDPVRVVTSTAGDEAQISVVDRGRGMSAEFVRSELFRPFTSTKEGGFGIGAYEARALVLAMGGRLTVESREGEGSRFTIHLPVGEAVCEQRRRRA